MTSAAGLRVVLFGRPALFVDGRERRLLSSRLCWPLLAYVIERAPGAVTRRALAELFWPDDDEDVALGKLRRHLHLLKSALEITGEPPALRVTVDSVAWQGGAVAVDSLWFEMLSSDDATVDAACALAREDYLLGYDDAWIEPVRERLRGRRNGALARSADLAWRRRELDVAERRLRDLLESDPWHEAGTRALMMLRYERGDRAGAIHCYETFAKRLREELDVEPMPETRIAFEHVLHRGAITVHPFQAEPERANFEALPFVGRDAELRLLREAWAAATRGTARIAFVSGEAGIGKSRLASEFARETAGAGGRVIAGATASPEAMPYQALVEALRAGLPLLEEPDLSADRRLALAKLLPELPSGNGTSEPVERERLFDAVCAALAALSARRPLLLVLEDVHAAGAATLALLSAIARTCAANRLLVLATFREGTLGRRDRLRAERRALVAEGLAVTIALGPLSRSALGDAVGRIDAQTGGGEALERILNQSEGNPLVVSELIRHRISRGEAAHAPAGLSIAALLEIRLGRLSDEARYAATLAACIGNEFSYEVLGEAAGFGERQTLDAVGELLDARLVGESTTAYGTLRFAHQLYAARIYESVDEKQRKRWHHRIATVMADVYDAGGDAAASTIAWHHERAGDGALGAVYALSAARSAVAVFADDDALNALEQAVRDAGTGAAEFEARSLREEINFRNGDSAASEKELAAMSRLAFEHADVTWLLATLERRIRSLRVGSRPGDAAGAVDTFLTIAECIGDARAASRARRDAAQHAFGEGETQRALDLVDAALATAGDEPDQRVFLESLVLKAEIVTALGRLDEALELIERCRGRARGAADRALLLRAVMAATAVALTRQNYGTLETLATEALALSREIHEHRAQAEALWRLGIVAARAFRVGEARERFAEAARLLAAQRNALGEALVLVNAANLELETGRLDLAESMLAQAEELQAATGSSRLRVVVCHVRAQLSVLENDADAIERAAREALALSVAQGVQRDCNIARSFLGMALSRRGRYDEAVAAFEEAIAGEREVQQQVALKDDLGELAVALVGAGRPAEAVRPAAELEALLDSSDAPMPHQIRHLSMLAQVAAAGGGIREARRLLNAAHEAIERFRTALPDEPTREAFDKLPHVLQVVREFQCAAPG